MSPPRGVGDAKEATPYHHLSFGSVSSVCSSPMQGPAHSRNGHGVVLPRVGGKLAQASTFVKGFDVF